MSCNPVLSSFEITAAINMPCIWYTDCFLWPSFAQHLHYPSCSFQSSRTRKSSPNFGKINMTSALMMYFTKPLSAHLESGIQPLMGGRWDSLRQEDRRCILTWASLRCRAAASRFLSEPPRYFCLLKVFSNVPSCSAEKAVRILRGCRRCANSPGGGGSDGTGQAAAALSLS